MTDHSITPPLDNSIKFIFVPSTEEVIRIDKEGFYYKGQFIEDAGEAHCLLVEFLRQNDALCAARYPKPPSLKEQALQALLHLLHGAAHSMDTTEPAHYIRRALEQLDD